MGINVVYNNFVLRETNPTPDDIAQIKKAIKDDISWGTHTSGYCAVDDVCRNRTWLDYSPRFSFTRNAIPAADTFELSFRKEAFNLESEGIDHLIGTVAGDIILNSKLKSIDVADFSFTKDLSDFFPGPSLGIEGIYDLFETKKQPLLAFSIKPRMGYSIEEFEKIYREVSEGGANIIEDDERMIDPIYCPLEKRILIAETIQKKFKGTYYSANITGPFEKMKHRIDFAAEHHIRFVKIDVLVCGFDALREATLHIKKQHNGSIAITVYPDVIGRYRNLSRDFILKMSRLCGADIIYAGSPNWSRDSVYDSGIILEIEKVFARHKMLSDDLEWAPHVKATMATMTNDFYAQRAELVTLLMQQYLNHVEYAFFVGGGISNSSLGLKKATIDFMSRLQKAAQWNWKSDYFFNETGDDKAIDDFKNIDVTEMLRRLI